MAMPGSAMWSPDGRRLFFTRLPTPTLIQAARGTFEAPPPSAALFDRTTGLLAEHPLPGAGSGEAPPTHLGWTASGWPLLVAARFQQKGGPRYAVHLMDPATGSTEAMPAIAANSPPQLVDGRLLLYEVGAQQSEAEARVVAFLDLASRRESRVPLPAGNEDWAIAADGRRLVVATREVDETSAWLRVSLVDVATGATTPLLGPPELPLATLAEVARRELGWVTLTSLRGTPWVRCDAEVEGRPRRSWLLDLGEETVPAIAIDPRQSMDGDDEAMGPGGPRAASPDGHRFLRWRLAGSQQAPNEESVVVVEELGPAGLREVSEHRFAGSSPAWLGNDRILYLRQQSEGVGLGQGELWVLDLATGVQRRFFNGDQAPAAR
jgi:hypothetical protein